METATRLVLPSASVYSPAACSHSPGVGVQAVESQALVLAGVLHARLLEVFQNHGGEVLLLAGFLLGDVPFWFSSAVDSTRCGERLSTENGPHTRTRLLSS